MRTVFTRFLLLCGWACAVGLLAHPAPAQRFYPDDPIWEDPDRLDMPPPQPNQADDGFDPVSLFANTFGQPGSHRGPAVNVNTLGEVPNSSWYTNRHYHHPMAPEALARGPNTGAPPDTAAPWIVTGRADRRGLPHATFRDATGRTFRLHVDPKAHPELATGAAMIASRLLYALGYNVPEHWLMRIRPGQVVAAGDSALTQQDLAALFARAPLGPEGTYRVLVTRIPNIAQRLGPFAFHGTRPDDANDIFPHEARRELRGLRVVAAWINHSKIRSSHTQDVLVKRGNRRVVRHYLTPLLTTLGSGGAAPKAKWSGHEHILEVRSIMTRLFTLGLSGGEWMEATAPDLRGVGHFTATHFQPDAWQPEYPNPAFERCDAADAFWAARQIAHFTRDELAAIVQTAQYADTSAAQYLVETLQRRQAAITEAYLDHGGGLDRFAIRDERLHFVDLMAQHGLAADSVRRTVRWHVFKNEADTLGALLRQATTAAEVLPLPAQRPAFLRVAITTPGRGITRAYLRRTPSGRYEVVGLDRA